jgi:hypothetical protein
MFSTALSAGRCIFQEIWDENMLALVWPLGDAVQYL